jgi:hypothetical protein
MKSFILKIALAAILLLIMRDGVCKSPWDPQEADSKCQASPWDPGVPWESEPEPENDDNETEEEE